MTTKEKQQYDLLTAKEKQIYDSVLQYFSNTSYNSAYDVAIQGGIKFQFICK